jgi:hypothetical protein
MGWMQKKKTHLMNLVANFFSFLGRIEMSSASLTQSNIFTEN